MPTGQQSQGLVAASLGLGKPAFPTVPTQTLPSPPADEPLPPTVAPLSCPAARQCPQEAQCGSQTSPFLGKIL